MTSNWIMSSDVSAAAGSGLGWTVYVLQTEAGLFTPNAVNNQSGESVYLGGEDDEDCATPEEAIEQGKRLLAEQIERGNVEP